MKNHLLGLSIANNTLFNEPSFDDALHKCVKVLGESHGIDRCYILKIEKKSVNYSYDWCNNEVNPLLDKANLVEEICDHLPKMHCGFFKDEPIQGLINEFDTSSFNKIMNSRNVKSYFFTPIFNNSNFWGLLACEDCKIEKRWSIEQAQSLHLLAINIGTRLHKDLFFADLEAKIENLNFYEEDSHYGMWEIDLLTMKVKFSDHWSGMLGYAIDEFEHSYDFFKNNVHQEDILRVEKELYDYISNYSDTYEGVLRMRHKEGNYVWLKYKGLIKRDLKGRSVKIIGRNIDTNEIENREIQLRLAEKKFRFIEENISEIICQHKIDGSFYYVSSLSKEILGYDPEELVNNKALDYIHQDDRATVKRSYSEFIKNAKNKSVTYRFRKKNNTYVWLETTLKSISNDHKTVVGMHTSSRDVSEKIENAHEMKMVLANEKEYIDKKFKFVSMASHQFRTPLTVIYSNAELITMKMNGLEKKIVNSINFSLDRIKNEVDRMNELMSNILIFGQHDGKEIKKDIRPVDLITFIEILVDTYFSNDDQKRQVHLVVKGNKKLIYTDESLLLHILTNLIGNAFKYSIGKSDPLLVVTYLKSKIKIQIIDFGIGIPENEIQYLFTSFFRASNTNTIEGSGLGLVIAKKFTDFLNGKIEIKTKEGFGTKIKLIFPYDQK